MEGIESLDSASEIQADFLHKVVEKSGSGTRLHVYIEGDGKPWRTKYAIARDPSPRKPLMLKLMNLDPANALYLGRPCYYQTIDEKCNAHWWTDARYSRRVVDSMNQALDKFSDRSVQKILIGHSGGGTLAALMAGTRRDVEAVVTLAGNLNVLAWTKHHGYTPLKNSLDPAEQEPLPENIRQVHMLGGDDQVIKREMLEGYTERQLGTAGIILVDSYGHSCCWHKEWPEILKRNDLSE